MTGLKRGSRFRAFPRRTVRNLDGTYTVPVYRVTQVRRYESGMQVRYRVDDDGNSGQFTASLTYLEANGLTVLDCAVSS